MKMCIRCLEEKPFSEFHKYKTQKDGLHYYCKVCRKTIENNDNRRNYSKKYRSQKISNFPEHYKHHKRKKRYGITPEQYLKMFSDQEGKCLICGQPETCLYRDQIRSLAVDHNHETGQVRGLLCNGCNNGLGRFKDDPSLLRLAAAYLESFGR